MCNRVKTPGGVMLVFTDDANKRHEFEFPCQAMTPEENEKRVQKWVEVLIDLKEGKKYCADDLPVSMKSQAHSFRSTQLSESRSQKSVATLGRLFGL